jgi:pantothenate kinase
MKIQIEIEVPLKECHLVTALMMLNSLSEKVNKEKILECIKSVYRKQILENITISKEVHLFETHRELNDRIKGMYEYLGGSTNEGLNLVKNQFNEYKDLIDYGHKNDKELQENKET